MALRRGFRATATVGARMKGVLAGVFGVVFVSLALAAPAVGADPAPGAQTQQFALAGQKAVKVLVDHDGWYRVRFTDLRKVGFAVPKKTANLQLWVNGAQVPIEAPRGAVEFYGQAIDTPDTDTQAYWLVIGKKKGLRVRVAKARARAGQPRGSYVAKSALTPRMDYNASILNGDDPNVFGPPFGFGLVATVKVPAAHVNAAASASLRVAVQGFSLVNHVAKVTWNGTALGNLTFKGQVPAAATFPLPAGTIKEGDNTVSFASGGGEIDISLVQSLELTYQHLFVADGDVLSFAAPAGQVTTVGGFSTKNIRVVDISRPDRPRELVPTRAGSAGNYTATLRVPSGSSQLYAFANFKALTPGLQLNAPSTLNAATQSADLLIISHSDFLSALKPLVDLRQQEGFKTALIDVQDVYDEFSFGAKNPDAIQSFLAWTRAHWQKAPRYVLLVGDASNDPRNFSGQGSFDFVPTRFVDTQYLEAPSDDSLADFNGDGIPEMAVGRLPVRTAQEAGAVVAKLVRYDQATRPRSVLLVADKNIDYDFEAQTATLFGLIPPDVTVSTVYRNQGPTDAAVRSRLLAALSQGPTIVNFFGHGAISIWTNASILKQADAASLTNANSLSLYLMMTCLNGYFVDPKAVALGESLLLAPNGGAIATWSSSGETVPTDQVIADQQAVKLLLANPTMTLGEAMLTGKSVIRDVDVRRTWVLLGDPTTRLH